MQLTCELYPENCKAIEVSVEVESQVYGCLLLVSVQLCKEVGSVGAVTVSAIEGFKLLLAGLVKLWSTYCAFNVR